MGNAVIGNTVWFNGEQGVSSSAQLSNMGLSKDSSTLDVLLLRVLSTECLRLRSS